MAFGYAQARPPLHQRIVEMAGLAMTRRALDVGCGSGLSTQALQRVAAACVGIEPVRAMLEVAPSVAPAAAFVRGRAEAMPFAKGSFDLMSAAGSLNYIDLDLFFPEALHVLTPGGALLLYDFSQGRRFSGSSALEFWFAEFVRRYPPPPAHGRSLDPEALQPLACGFRLTTARRFEIALGMTAGAYAAYIMTETNVAYAIERGASIEEVRSWCEESLAGVFEGAERDVVFQGYYAVLNRL
jgi:SAM-dependent methyltransferase